MSELRDEIQQVRRQYPEGTRSAVMPALRLAQEHYGWLSPEALREVADALELTPAYCESIASFYDMLHLQPVGRHMVEVCTNVSCALVGAQQVLEEFESELGVHAGETTDDGEVTLRTVECLATCHWAVAAQVNYLDVPYLTPDRARKLVEDLRAGRDLDEILTELRGAKTLQEARNG